MPSGRRSCDTDARSYSYSSVVTRETACTDLTMAALHDIDGKAADILNVYVTAPN